jgi:hypothetical protein
MSVDTEVLGRLDPTAARRTKQAIFRASQLLSLSEG